MQATYDKYIILLVTFRKRGPGSLIQLADGLALIRQELVRQEGHILSPSLSLSFDQKC